MTNLPPEQDPRITLFRYLRHAGYVRLDRTGRKRLSAALRIDDHRLVLAVFDLNRRGVVRLVGNHAELIEREAAA